jgi:hypothetical protein
VSDATEETEPEAPAAAAAAGAGDQEAGEQGKGTGEATPPGASGPSPLRTPAFVVARTVIVLVIAAVGYQLVIPQKNVDRTRLAKLVVTEPGVKKFDVKPTGAAEQKAASSGLKTMEAAVKKSPNSTGIYSIEWTAKGSKNVTGIIAFLLPTEADAKATLTQVRTQQLAAKSYTSDSLTRSSTFTVAGVPGSSGSFYEMTKKTATSLNLAATVFRTGDVVAVAEGITATDTQADTETVTRTEYAHLQSVAPGFTLTPTTRPAVASLVWIAGSVVVALLAGFGPVVVGRIRRTRRQRRQAELDRLIVVRGQTIAKRRRTSGD